MGFIDAAIQAILPNRRTAEPPNRRIAGTAVTLALPGQDSALLHHVVQFLRPNDVLVIDRLGDRKHACLGGGAACAIKATGCLVMPPSEAESDIDWALGKQASEPAAHRAMEKGERLGSRSGALAMVEAKLKAVANIY
jgi:hypothetical protein